MKQSYKVFSCERNSLEQLGPFLDRVEQWADGDRLDALGLIKRPSTRSTRSNFRFYLIDLQGYGWLIIHSYTLPSYSSEI
jgi:hypothetical protein